MSPVIVDVWSKRFRICVCPEPLEGGADFQLDYLESIIWLAPGLSAHRAVRVVAAAVSRAWEAGAGPHNAAAVAPG